jgi:acyl carrier protein
MTTVERIRNYIDRYLLEEPFEGEDPIAEEALDSVAMEELIDFLEDEYDVLFSEEDLARTRFRSVPAVAALINDK